MKVGSLVGASRDKYPHRYGGPGTLSLVIDMVHGPRGTSVGILVDGKAIWVSASMLEVFNEAR